MFFFNFSFVGFLIQYDTDHSSYWDSMDRHQPGHKTVMCKDGQLHFNPLQYLLDRWVWIYVLKWRRRTFLLREKVQWFKLDYSQLGTNMWRYLIAELHVRELERHSMIFWSINLSKAVFKLQCSSHAEIRALQLITMQIQWSMNEA